MGGISLRNLRQVSLPLIPEDAGDPPFSPAADAAIMATATAPADGTVDIVVTIANIGVKANELYVQTVEVLNAGYAGAGTTQITDPVVVMDTLAATDDLPAAGVKRVGLTNGVFVRQGQLIKIRSQDTGTFAGTRANYNAELLFSAKAHLDGSI